LIGLGAEEMEHSSQEKLRVKEQFVGLLV